MIGEGPPQFLMDREGTEGQEGHFWTQPSAMAYRLPINIYCCLQYQTSPHVNVSKSVKAKTDILLYQFLSQPIPKPFRTSPMSLSF